MIYKVYDNDEQLHGQFLTVTDLELYMDGVRNSRGDRYKELPRYSCFDFIKSIGWYLDIVDDSSQSGTQ